MNTTLFAASARNLRMRSGALIGALVGTALLAGCAGQTPVPITAAAPTLAPQTAPSTSVNAARPAGATLKIVSPTPAQVLNAGPVKVSIDYAGPTLVPAAQSTRLEDYHLHYILDEDASMYVGSARPIPAGNPSIIHSAAKEVTFDNVAPGEHTVTVVMSGSNHISVSAPLTDTVKFRVQ